MFTAVFFSSRGGGEGGTCNGRGGRFDVDLGESRAQDVESSSMQQSNPCKQETVYMNTCLFIAGGICGFSPAETEVC